MGTTYYIGYNNVDNYIYSLEIIYLSNKYKINGNDVLIKNNKLITYDFQYEGQIKPTSFCGTSTIVYNNILLSSGQFYTTAVSESTYNKYKQYKSAWQWMLTKLKYTKPIIYKELNEPLSIITPISFNICSSFRWTGDNGLLAVVDIIRKYKADIVLPQEINKKTFYKLAKILNYNADYKGGVISKYKIVDIYKRSLMSPIYGVKLMIAKNIYIRAFNSHLDNNGYYNIDKAMVYQLPHLKLGLLDVYNKNNNPLLATIMGGDHNIVSHLDEDKPWPVSLQLYREGWIDSYREVNKVVLKEHDITFPNCDTRKIIIKNEIGTKLCNTKSDRMKLRIDYIYSKNGKDITLKPIESKIINKHDNILWPSDHNAVVSRLLVLK